MTLHPKVFVRDMFRAGARKVLHRAGFRQPGGGRTFHRWNGRIRQEVSLWHSWTLDEPGDLSFTAWQWFENVPVWRSRWPRRFVVDPFFGDPRDLAVEVGEWFRVELLPRLEPELDPLAVAREYEALAGANELQRAERLYRALGLAEDAARVHAAWEAQIPF